MLLCFFFSTSSVVFLISNICKIATAGLTFTFLIIVVQHCGMVLLLITVIIENKMWLMFCAKFSRRNIS